MGGWRPQEGTTDRLAALLVGEPTAEGLIYRGRVGSGIGAKQSRALDPAGGAARAGRTARSPTRCPAVDARGTHWVEPVLVVDVETHGRGYARLRQPSYQGVRSDLSADQLEARRGRRWRWPPDSAGPDLARAAERSTSLDGVDVALREQTRQVVTVNHTSGYRARVTFWVLTGSGWQRAVAGATTAGSGTAAWCSARKRRAGHRDDAARHLRPAVGLRHAAAGAAGGCDYRRIRRGDFWVRTTARASTTATATSARAGSAGGCR